MVRFNRIMILIGVLVMGQNSLARENRLQAYLAKQIPVTSKNCHEQSSELAQNFSRLTGIAAAGRCESTSSKGNDILISYEATEPLNVVTSATEIGFPGQGYEFTTKSQCENNLPGETKAFRDLTGTDPLLTFCRSQENYYGRVRWALIVEGFGKTDKKIAWASSLFPGQPPKELMLRVTSDIKNTFSDASMTVRHAFLQDDEHGHLRLTVNYFGKYDEQIQTRSLASVNTMTQCELALADIQSISNADKNLKTLSYCVINPYSRGADLVIVIDVTKWYRLRQAAESFKSYADCAAARMGLLDLYRSHYPEKILAGFCTEWGPDWKINLLYPADPS